MNIEKQRMLAGELYDPRDPQLSAERLRARRLFRAYNASPETPRAERRRLLRKLIPASGRDLLIEPPFYCDYGTNIEIGDNVFFNFGCVILDIAPVRIGSNVLFGPMVQLYGATHPLSAAGRRAGLESGGPIDIGDDVWIGGGAIVCPGVRIGSRTTIGAGSVVTRDIPDQVFAAGNPCKVIRAIEP